MKNISLQLTVLYKRFIRFKSLLNSINISNDFYLLNLNLLEKKCILSYTIVFVYFIYSNYKSFYLHEC